MGASYAQKLRDLGNEVHGYDMDSQVNFEAVKDKVILSSNLDEIKTSDLVILALYPKDNITFVKKHKNLFKDQLVTDLAGSKLHLVEELDKIFPKSVRYVPHHPMAGREKRGYFNRDVTMFDGANFLVSNNEKVNEVDYNQIEALGKMLGFGRITRLTAKEHDKLIAHTSQLTHLLAVGLMLSEDEPHTKLATGDSYRDLTRIAKINEDLWTELFLDNKGPLIEQIEHFTKVLEKLKNDIQNDKVEDIKKALRDAKEKRILFDDFKRKWVRYYNWR